MTGFCLRFFKPMVKAKELLGEGRVGRIVTARSFTGAYLPDWHPWEDYRTFYMAKKEMGGGVLLDECHAFDWMQWLVGPIQGVFSVVGTLSDLEVTSDDVCEVIARFGPAPSARSTSTWSTGRRAPRSRSSAPPAPSAWTCTATP